MCALVPAPQPLQGGEEAAQRPGLADEGGHRVAQGGGAVGRAAVVGDAGDERDAAQLIVSREEGQEAPARRISGGGEVEDDGGGGEEAQHVLRAGADAEGVGGVPGVGQDLAQQDEERLIVVEDGDAWGQGRGDGQGDGHGMILSWWMDVGRGEDHAPEDSDMARRGLDISVRQDSPPSGLVAIAHVGYPCPHGEHRGSRRAHPDALANQGAV